MPRNFWDAQLDTPFYDKEYSRPAVAAWDERWHGLSIEARRGFLQVPLPLAAGLGRKGSGARLAPAAVGQLLAAGFVRGGEVRGGGVEVVVAGEALDFARRIHGVNRFHLLAPRSQGRLATYITQYFSTYRLAEVIREILERAGASNLARFNDLYQVALTRRSWPGWVAAYLESPSFPLARPLLAVVEEAGGRLPLAEVTARLPRPAYKPEDVRATLDRLVTHLALFEDLDPNTLELEVGLLPAVWADRERAVNPPPRPALNPTPPEGEPGPAEGTLIPDLRAFLLELAARRARLRRGGSLYQKEVTRFQAVLAPLPAWLSESGPLSPEHRVDQAMRWARGLQLVVEMPEGEQSWLDLTQPGRDWLAAGLERQYGVIFKDVRERASSLGDESNFLGSNVTAVEPVPGDAPHTYDPGGLDARKRAPLREALYRTFQALPVGVFYRLDDFLAHASHGEYNPLLLGRGVAGAEVRVGGHLLPPLEERLEEVSRQVLRGFVQSRLIPLGCVQVGRDREDSPLIARLPRLDSFFGHGEPPRDGQGEAPAATRVVVQPDFSVVVIGLDPGPAAELAPFCERVRGSAGSGSMTFRLTRDSVVTAIAAGLAADEVMARLQRCASNPVPGNVRQEVRGWCDWVRTVTTGPATLIRCPDSDTADRVQSSLGKKAERLNPTTVALAGGRLATAERQKLRQQGVLVEGGAGEEKPKAKKKRGR